MKIFPKILVVTTILTLAAVVANAGELIPMKGKVDKAPSRSDGSQVRGELDCSNAIEVELGTTYSGTNVGAPNNVTFYSCSTWNESGGEVVYHVNFPEGVVWEVSLVPSGCDLDLAVLDQCDEDLGCLGVFDNGVSAPVPLPGEFYFVVDGYDGAACDFEITFTTAPYVPPSGEVGDFCADVFDLNGSIFSGNTCDGVNNVFEVGDCGAYQENGLEHYYEVFMPVGSEFQAYVTNTADGALWILDGCAGTVSCLGYADDTGGGGTEVAFWYNGTDMDKTVYLVIDSYGLDTCGDYTLEFISSGGAIATELTSFGSVKVMYR